MSKNRNRAKLNKANNNVDYNKFLLKMLYPTYWEENYNLFPRWRAGHERPKKQILSHQKRRYKTWKHNRKTQWK